MGCWHFAFPLKRRRRNIGDREWQSVCMYTKLCAFREETEEIQLVAGLITFLLLDTCEIPKHHAGFIYL